MYGWCTYYTQHKTLPKSPASLKFSFIIVFRYFFSPPFTPYYRIVALTMFALNSYTYPRTRGRVYICTYNYERARTSLWKGMGYEMAFWLHIYIYVGTGYCISRPILPSAGKQAIFTGLGWYYNQRGLHRLPSYCCSSYLFFRVYKYLRAIAGCPS